MAEQKSSQQLAAEKLQGELKKAGTGKGCAEAVIGHLIKRCGEDPGLAEDVLSGKKCWGKCEKYIISMARKEAGNRSCVAVRDDQVFEWAEDYYRMEEPENDAKEKQKKTPDHAEDGATEPEKNESSPGAAPDPAQLPETGENGETEEGGHGNGSIKKSETNAAESVINADESAISISANAAEPSENVAEPSENVAEPSENISEPPESATEVKEPLCQKPEETAGEGIEETSQEPAVESAGEPAEEPAGKSAPEPAETPDVNPVKKRSRKKAKADPDPDVPEKPGRDSGPGTNDGTDDDGGPWQMSLFDMM